MLRHRFKEPPLGDHLDISYKTLVRNSCCEWNIIRHLENQSVLLFHRKPSRLDIETRKKTIFVQQIKD
jgi:hypothetical protein